MNEIESFLVAWNKEKTNITIFYACLYWSPMQIENEDQIKWAKLQDSKDQEIHQHYSHLFHCKKLISNKASCSELAIPKKGNSKIDTIKKNKKLIKICHTLENNIYGIFIGSNIWEESKFEKKKTKMSYWITTKKVQNNIELW
jgi:hypothetical protein